MKQSFTKSTMRKARRGVFHIIRRDIAEDTARAFHSFDQARQLRATYESMDYADANMQDATVYEDKIDVLRHGVEQVGLDGLFLEFGVWSGRTINFVADRHAGPVHGFDSFEGLPEDWALNYTKGTFATDGQLPDVRDNVHLHVGWFDDTLPSFVADHTEPVAFLHVDCDLYSSTKTIFDALGDRIVAGTVIVFDEYFNYPGWQQHEFKAFQELVADKGLSYRYVAYNQCEFNVAVVID